MKKKITKKQERMHDLGRQWITARRREYQYALQRQALGEILIEQMKRSGHLTLKVGKATVAVVSQKQKRIYKKHLEALLGPKKTAELWKKLPWSRDEYLSIMD